MIISNPKDRHFLLILRILDGYFCKISYLSSMWELGTKTIREAGGTVVFHSELVI